MQGAGRLTPPNAKRHWQSADLEAVVRGELGTLLDADNGSRQLSIAGPAVTLPADSVQPLSMALHELATNALKYGALSVREGRLDLTWRMEQEGPGVFP